MTIKKYGLLGKNIDYSFSRNYFTEKFKKEKISNCKYVNFDIPDIQEFPFIWYQREELFGGMNVTIPYKESVMKYLHEIDADAKTIGAVNTIKFTDDFKLVGYNTDVHGFKESLMPLLQPQHKKALILGTGGASKAVAFALQNLGIEFSFVSRSKKEGQFDYNDLGPEILKTHTLIINCTPIGTFPDTDKAPHLDYNCITKAHLLYDLIYNPEKTMFLKNGEAKGAQIKNGHQMLVLQAEKSWEIWNS